MKRSILFAAMSLAGFAQTPAPTPAPGADAPLRSAAIEALSSRVEKMTGDAVRSRLSRLSETYSDSHPAMRRIEAKLHRMPGLALGPDFKPGGDAYGRGSSALYRGEWEDATKHFEEASKKGPRADGALYWKAWAQHKAGAKDAALATLARLKSEHPQSRWANDAEALAVEVRQSSGQPVSPEALTNEEIKLYALNGLVNSDPERALPMLQKIAAGPGSPRLRQRALFVLAQIPSPQARDTLVKLAQGQNANPDMQYYAVRYLGQSRDKEVPGVLAQIYASTGDVAIKRQILGSYSRHKARERLIEAAANEKDASLRETAVHELAGMNDARALIELARKEQNPAVTKTIVRALSGMKSKEAGDYLLELLSR